MVSLAILDDLLAAMPPVAAMQIHSAAFKDDCLHLRAPLAANVNDKNCAFGGSQASVMTLAAWGWLMLKLRESGTSAEVYVADSQIRYLAPLYDDLLGEAHLAEGQDWNTILHLLGSRKRARAMMVAQMRNALGETVATLHARFALLAPTRKGIMAP